MRQEQVNDVLGRNHPEGGELFLMPDHQKLELYLI